MRQVEAVVYFAGPLSLWADKPDEREYVARFESRWAWLAHSRALSVYRSLNSGRCGYFVRVNGEFVAHVAPEHLPMQGEPA